MRVESPEHGLRALLARVSFALGRRSPKGLHEPSSGHMTSQSPVLEWASASEYVCSFARAGELSWLAAHSCTLQVKRLESVMIGLSNVGECR